jgi:hypothetical protein
VFDGFVMWLELWLNIASWIALLVAYPTKALTNPVFYLKLALIGAALAILKIVRRDVLADTAPPAVASRRGLKWLAVASLACWIGAITAGRLLAYTYVRFMATP